MYTSTNALASLTLGNKKKIILKDKSSAQSNFMSWSSKRLKAEFVSQHHLRPLALLGLKFHEYGMKNADATSLIRHVPSINRACKFQLTGNL